MGRAIPNYRDRLAPLLDYFAVTLPETTTSWERWQIAPIRGGANNLLYHVCRDDEHGDYGDPLAVKFCIRDARDRAGREYAALLALQQAGLAIAPRPVLLEQTAYPHPLIVQTWLDGQVADDPPIEDAEWECLLRHLAAVHRFIPQATAIPLRQAVLAMGNTDSGKRRILEQVERIPAEVQPDTLRGLVAQMVRTTFPEWPAPQPALCRCDITPSNFIRGPDDWKSVDWEYSGWGDPALDIAGLMAHPACAKVPVSRWN
jgi:aminoglycoside phosphotransferase (APT) family kinase protein